MSLKIVFLILSLSRTLAYPLHSDSGEADFVGSDANQAHDKSDLTKDVHRIYKNIIDSRGLYNQEDNDNKNPLAAEMQSKLSMESERLRMRLRQELAELRERLSPSSVHLSATLASMRERLTPLTQQLQKSLSSSNQDLCSQLSLYLQGLETAEAQTEAGPALYQEAFHWISQTLEHSSLQMANIITEFHSKAKDIAAHLKQTDAPEEEEEENNSKVWTAMSSKLGQEVSSLREGAQNRVGALKAQLAALIESTQPLRAEVTDRVEQFCQNAELQDQVLQAQMERLFIGVEEEVSGASSSSLQPPSLSTQQGGSLQEDFSAKLSALIQDIMHSVQ